VAEVTGKESDVILSEMPLAIGRQFEHIFYVKHNVKVKSIIKIKRSPKII
jgi:hypothetical protein